MEERVINEMFTYHSPVGNQQKRYILIRDKAKELAHLINNECPESEDKKRAINKLRNCVMFANVSIALENSNI